jgi:uncharacterized protein (TIGR02466 family)
MNIKNVGEHSLFPTLVLSFEDFISEQQRTDIVRYSRSGQLKNHPAITHSKGGSNYTLSSDICTEISKQYESCSNFCYQIQEALNVYCDHAGWTNVMLSNSWTSTQYPYSELKSHMHPGSVVSGCIYIQVDENSSPLHLYSPNPFTDFTMTTEKTQYSVLWEQFKPKNCLMLLFPSWIKHGSNGILNQSDERIILSFNSIVRQYK